MPRLTTQVTPFANHLPIDVRFGEGTLAALPDVLDALPASRVVVVADPAVAGLPAVSATLDAARRHGRTIEVIALDAGEPTTASVDQVAATVADARAEAVVGLGGGSALDTAKGARLVAAQGGPITRYTWPGDPAPIEALPIPLIAIPTTAGTGSEVTGGIVLRDPTRSIKVSAPSPHNRARVALVDPELTYGLPPGPTLHGGLDVVAQAIGAMTATTRTPVADGIALEALRIARDALPAVVADGGDVSARSRIACASLMAGLAMNLSEVSSDHSLGHALGARHDVPHGLAVGLVLAAAMDHDRRADPAPFERIADALGAPPRGPPDGSRAVLAVERLLAGVRCPTLADSGVVEADLDALAETALAAWIPVSPATWTRDDARAAFGHALATRRAPAPVAPVAPVD